MNKKINKSYAFKSSLATSCKYLLEIEIIQLVSCMRKIVVIMVPMLMLVIVKASEPCFQSLLPQLLLIISQKHLYSSQSYHHAHESDTMKFPKHLFHWVRMQRAIVDAKCTVKCASKAEHPDCYIRCYFDSFGLFHPFWFRALEGVCVSSFSVRHFLEFFSVWFCGM